MRYNIRWFCDTRCTLTKSIFKLTRGVM